VACFPKGSAGSTPSSKRNGRCLESITCARPWA
jgi:hypothetical protein